MESLWRVTFVTSGLRRKSRTVTEDQKNSLQRSGHAGIRVISVKRATEAQTKKGPYQGNVYV